MRIGNGYDVHRLGEGRKLIVGGVDIPYDRGLIGHSDADVLIHAVMDALLGAMAKGDIGLHFPDSDERYKDASSMVLLGEVARMVQSEGMLVENIDSVIMAEKPKFRPYIDEMRRNIASALGLDISQVSVKATTEEGLGFTGREEGIAASAVCILSSVQDAASFGVDIPVGCGGCPSCPAGRTE
ncbi:MAG: 2-C-methyl-D-erythritol 2,4-cyclodiphosphate synthase [Lachnospiraceae bacterium]|nr:2-C-methyl-D-erythritol 2,4-cyclodiphosphate synthase [Lachnospiraceae bacterium]